jgi:hypothetical protein
MLRVPASRSATARAATALDANRVGQGREIRAASAEPSFRSDKRLTRSGAGGIGKLEAECVHPGELGSVDRCRRTSINSLKRSGPTSSAHWACNRAMRHRSRPRLSLRASSCKRVCGRQPARLAAQGIRAPPSGRQDSWSPAATSAIGVRDRTVSPHWTGIGEGGKVRVLEVREAGGADRIVQARSDALPAGLQERAHDGRSRITCGITYL